jgi:multidrug efflux pump
LNGVDLADFVASNVQEPISRTAGVGDYFLFGSEYAMRIWLDPAKLNNFSLTPADVSAAIQAQNVQVASGELGGLPARAGQQLNATIVGPSYLQTPEQFGTILLKVESSGAQVLLRDVARIEFGGVSYGIDAQVDGRPAAALAVKLAGGANALDTVAGGEGDDRAASIQLSRKCGRRVPLRHVPFHPLVDHGRRQDAA